MKQLIMMAAASAAFSIHPFAAAHALAPAMQVDTAGGAEISDAGDIVQTGTRLTRTLERIERGDPLTVDFDVAVTRPVSLPAGTYAHVYGIPADLAQQIIDIATAEGLDPELGFRLVRVESVFSRRARGPQGALGLTQLMPSTARAIDRSVRTEAQIMEPSTNLRLGFSYLRRLIERFDGDVRLGLLAYNRGEGTVARALRAGRDPENGYSRKVLGTRGARPYRGLGILSAPVR